MGGKFLPTRSHTRDFDTGIEGNGVGPRGELIDKSDNLRHLLSTLAQTLCCARTVGNRRPQQGQIGDGFLSRCPTCARDWRRLFDQVMGLLGSGGDTVNQLGTGLQGQQNNFESFWLRSRLGLAAMFLAAILAAIFLALLRNGLRGAA